MVKQFALLLFTLCFSYGALAIECKNIKRFDLEHCAAHKVRFSEEILNDTYASIKDKIPRREYDRLVVAQYLWAKYKDSVCEGAGVMDGDGAEPPIVKLSCLSKQNDLRTDELKYLVGDSEIDGFYAYLIIENARREGVTRKLWMS